MFQKKGNLVDSVTCEEGSGGQGTLSVARNRNPVLRSFIKVLIQYCPNCLDCSPIGSVWLTI